MLDEVKNYDSVGKLGLKGSALTPSGFPRINGLSGPRRLRTPYGTQNGSLYFEDKPTADLSLTWVHGNHTSKIGGDWRIDVWTNRQYNQAIGNYSFSNAQTGQPSTQASPVTGGAVGYSYASFLLGMASGATVGAVGRSAVPQNVDVPVYPGHVESYPPLHIGYGLRWDLSSPTREIFNRWSAFSPNVANPAAGGLLGATIYEGDGPGRCNCQFTPVYPFADGASAAPIRSTPRPVLRAGWGISTLRSTSLAISAPAARSAPAGTPLPSRPITTGIPPCC